MSVQGRLRSNAQFRKVLSDGRAAANDLAVLYVLRHEGPNCAGVSAPRRLGGAVIRNRVRRRFWEAYRSCRLSTEEGLWLVFIARPAAKDAGFEEILAAVKALLERLGLAS